MICCYNSRTRLRPTLEHLGRQTVRAGLAWEIIVVDNASTDGTAEFARECWSTIESTSLRIVHEAKQGLSAARFRAVREAKYEIISFIDDDNWVCAEWVNLVDEIMSARTDVGACGGYNVPVFESQPPGWFQRFEHRFAVGAQADAAGDITDSKGVLWGAGLSVRRLPLLRLIDAGFTPLTTDRRGAALSSGGDYEICFALRLAGFRLIYDPRLVIHHFMPTNRLNWRILRQMARGSGASGVARDPYQFLLTPWYRDRRWWWRTWWWRALICLPVFLRHPFRFLRALFSERTGDPDVLYVESAYGRFCRLLRERGIYDARVRKCREFWSRGWRQQL